MVLVLAPLRGQPGELLDIPTIGQSSQLCLQVDSTSLPVSVNTDQVTNVSGVPGGTASAALDNIETQVAALQPALGYVQRIWFTTPGTFVVFATAADVPPCTEIELVSWSGGAAGANGRFQNAAGSSSSGNSGAGAGVRHARRFNRGFILSQLPISVTIGTGVSPPAAPTVQNTDQTSTVGTDTFWSGSGGVLVSAYGGGAGQALNLASGGSGGGFLGRGQQTGTSNGNTGGAPGATLLAQGVSGGGGHGGDEGSTLGNDGFAACGGGGAGGGSGVPPGAPAAGNGGNADEGAGAGGGSGALDTGTSPANSRAGGRGGQSGNRSDGVLSGSGAAGGTAGAPGGPGADAVDLLPIDANYYKSGTGGGGGASSPAVGSVGGRGGNGGAPGGGGGAGANGRGANGTAWGGVGGNGARGQGAYTAWP